MKQISKEEFCARFKARMIAEAPFERFKNPDGTDSDTVAGYADWISKEYWFNADQRAEGPEECADADMSYWGED